MPANPNFVSKALSNGAYLRMQTLNGTLHDHGRSFGYVSGMAMAPHLRKDGVTEMKSVRVGASIDACNKGFSIKASANRISLNEVTTGLVDGRAVCYEGQLAAYGVVGSRSWLYSDGFSGCVWFIFRDANNRVHGVHASRSGGILEDPQDFYRQKGAKLLYVFDTASRMSTPTRLGQLAVMLCYVGEAEITCWALARDRNEKVTEVLDERVIPNWHRYELSSPPTFQRTSVPPPTPPAKNSFISKLRSLGRG